MQQTCENTQPYLHYTLKQKPKFYYRQRPSTPTALQSHICTTRIEWQNFKAKLQLQNYSHTRCCFSIQQTQGHLIIHISPILSSSTVVYVMGREKEQQIRGINKTLKISAFLLSHKDSLRTHCIKTVNPKISYI